MKIHKGDTVKIMAGKDLGKTGKVERVLGKDGKLFVAGINLVKRHVRSMQGMEGGIIDIVKPVNASNVALICPNCQKTTRVGYGTDKDNKFRICRKCKKEITVKE